MYEYAYGLFSREHGVESLLIFGFCMDGQDKDCSPSSLFNFSWILLVLEGIFFACTGSAPMVNEFIYLTYKRIIWNV